MGKFPKITQSLKIKRMETSVPDRSKKPPGMDLSPLIIKFTLLIMVQKEELVWRGKYGEIIILGWVELTTRTR